MILGAKKWDLGHRGCDVVNNLLVRFYFSNFWVFHSALLSTAPVMTSIIDEKTAMQGRRQNLGSGASSSGEMRKVGNPAEVTAELLAPLSAS